MKHTKYHKVIVDNNKQAKAFLDFPSRLYKHERNWIRPLDNEIEKVFDPASNNLFSQGDAIRWLLYDNSENILGKMAAFYNTKIARKNEQPTGGIGFFDCINDQEAANTLFDAGKAWLELKGMEAMDGPINFGDRDNFWGCLKEGFHEPVLNMPYNFAYYNELFQNYGFKNYFNQYTYHIDVRSGAKSPVIREKAKRLLKDPGYRFETFNWKRYELYAGDFMAIYNKAWARFPGVSRIRRAHARALLNSLKPIIDSRTMLFGYYNNEPIAFYIMIPDINQITRKFNGKMNGINKLRFALELKVLKKCTRLIGLIFGVVPEFQGKGVESAIIARFEKEVFSKGFNYTDLEMNWVGDFNKDMMKLVDQIGGVIYKTHVTYRYLFDRTKPFKRASKSI